MLKTLRAIGADLREKAKWCYESDSLPTLAKTLVTDGTLAMILYRLMQSSRAHGLAPLEMVFNKMNSVLGGCIIGRGAEFRPGLLAHPLGRRGHQRPVQGGQLRSHRAPGEHRRRAPAEPGNRQRRVLLGGGQIFRSLKIGERARFGAYDGVFGRRALPTNGEGIPVPPVGGRTRKPPPQRQNPKGSLPPQPSRPVQYKAPTPSSP